VKLKHWMAIGGFCALVGGVAWVYPPAGLIVAGLVLIKAYLNMEKADAPKPR
jgi:hypothetical protein